jgi:hypothetical protein
MDPSKTWAARPTSVFLACALLWAMSAYFVVAGVLQLLLNEFAFGRGPVALVSRTPLNEYPAAAFAIGLFATAAFTVMVNRGLVKGLRRARAAAVLALVVLAAVVVASNSWGPAMTFLSAFPWFTLQVATMVCLFTPSANLWFRYGVGRTAVYADRTDSDAVLHLVTRLRRTRPCTRLLPRRPRTRCRLNCCIASPGP